MNDRLFRDLALAVAGGLIVWFLTQHQKNIASSSGSMVPDIPPAGYNIPQSDMYTPALGLQPAINIDIGNQGLNYLSDKLIPMFGFVGMAQNGMYQ